MSTTASNSGNNSGNNDNAAASAKSLLGSLRRFSLGPRLLSPAAASTPASVPGSGSLPSPTASNRRQSRSPSPAAAAAGAAARGRAVATLTNEFPGGSGSAPAPAPAELASGDNAGSARRIRQRNSRSPLSNPSPPTRRPYNEPPPPSYSEAVATSPVSPVSPVGPAELDAATGFAGPRSAAPRSASPAPSNASSSASRLTIDDVTRNEDPYAFLSSFDTVFVIDDSGSMAGRSWREVQSVLAKITPICTSHDTDGIDIYFLNHRSGLKAPGKASGGYNNVTSSATVNTIFTSVRPGASTPTGTRLDNILRPYLRHYAERATADPDDPGVKPINVIVITDGVPTDDLEGVLISAAKKLDLLDAPPYQVGLQFFQVGNEPGALEALQELDDNLGRQASSGVRDMVDTATWDGSSANRPALTADAILKVVLGAVVKRLDRQPIGAASRPRFLTVPA